MPDEVIATIIGVSCRTIARRHKSGLGPVKSPRGVVSQKPDNKGRTNLISLKTPSGARLSPVESDRLCRFARIIALNDKDRKSNSHSFTSPSKPSGSFKLIQA